MGKIPLRQIFRERAFPAVGRLLFAVMLANFNQQGMKLIEELRVPGQLAMDQFLGGCIIGV